MSMDNFRNNFRTAINKVFVNLFNEYMENRKYQIIKNMGIHSVVAIMSGRKKVTIELLDLIDDKEFITEYHVRVQPILNKVTNVVKGK